MDGRPSGGAQVLWPRAGFAHCRNAMLWEKGSGRLPAAAMYGGRCVCCCTTWRASHGLLGASATAVICPVRHWHRRYLVPGWHCQTSCRPPTDTGSRAVPGHRTDPAGGQGPAAAALLLLLRAASASAHTVAHGTVASVSATRPTNHCAMQLDPIPVRSRLIIYRGSRRAASLFHD